jgi:hypothetical protein
VNRTAVIERLRLGRAVALEVAGSGGDRRAFLYIQPRIDESVAKLVHADGLLEPSLIRKVPNADVVARYDVTHVEMNPGWEVYPFDSDQYVFERHDLTFATLQDLEHALHAQWGCELQAFRLPHVVDHPF